MTDIFISYSRAFRRQISPMVETLRELGLDVWFDAELLAGDVFSDEIESQLKAARCVLVLWTKDALDKGARGWVRSEADWAFQRGKLIQARLGSVRLPPPFFSSVAPPINLTAAIASGARLGAPGWKELLEAVGRFTKRPGLPHLPEAERSDAEMLAWAARYCDDPLAVADAGRASRISRRIQVAREAELIRIRRSANLESELKNLVQETRQAPIRYFDPAKASVASCQDGAEIWPGSANALLELDVNVYGLEFCDLTVERAFDGANPILLVAGEVRNIGRDTKFVPPVRITLRDARARGVFELIKIVADDPIGVGTALPFQIRIENPPSDPVDLDVTFASFAELDPVGGPARDAPSSGCDTELLLDTPVAKEADAADAAPGLARLLRNS